MSKTLSPVSGCVDGPALVADIHNANAQIKRTVKQYYHLRANYGAACPGCAGKRQQIARLCHERETARAAYWEQFRSRVYGNRERGA